MRAAGKGISGAWVHAREGKGRDTAEKGSEWRKTDESTTLALPTPAQNSLGHVTPSQTCRDQHHHGLITEGGEELSSLLSFHVHPPLPLSETGIRATRSHSSYEPPTQSRICHKKAPWEHKPFLFISLYYYHINGTFTGRMDAQVARKHSWLFPAPPREQGTVLTNPQENYGRVLGADMTIGSFL